MTDAAHNTRNNVTGLDTLIDRLQDGTGPDRELDEAIRFHLMPNDADTDWNAQRNYTESIDACLTLLGEVPPGFLSHISFNGTEKFVHGYMEVDGDGVEIIGEHTDLPRALLIAILEAKRVTA